VQQQAWAGKPGQALRERLRQLRGVERLVHGVARTRMGQLESSWASVGWLTPVCRARCAPP
jgi:hypothetical protein